MDKLGVAIAERHCAEPGAGPARDPRPKADFWTNDRTTSARCSGHHHARDVGWDRAGQIDHRGSRRTASFHRDVSRKVKEIEARCG
jgi:hypothetical protein